jgi:hypothetical protein
VFFAADGGTAAYKSIVASLAACDPPLLAPEAVLLFELGKVRNPINYQLTRLTDPPIKLSTEQRVPLFELGKGTAPAVQAAIDGLDIPGCRCAVIEPPPALPAAAAAAAPEPSAATERSAATAEEPELEPEPEAEAGDSDDCDAVGLGSGHVLEVRGLGGWSASLSTSGGFDQLKDVCIYDDAVRKKRSPFFGARFFRSFFQTRSFAKTGSRQARDKRKKERLEPKNQKKKRIFVFFLCLSRACLGKMIVFIYKWLKNAVFCRRSGCGSSPISTRCLLSTARSTKTASGIP